MKDLTEELTTLEEKATEVMNNCKQAEVGVILVLRASSKRMYFTGLITFYRQRLWIRRLAILSDFCGKPTFAKC